ALWFTNTPGAKLTFRFKGTAASLFDAMGPDTGRVKLTVDGQDKGIRQQVDPWCYYQRLSALPIASGLDDKEHLVTVELLPDPPDRSVPIAEAKKANQYNAKDFEGVALRIGWIRVIGEAAE
ncbi:MAG: SGNH/GDSL hydrolase family protein, partial [Armatimonadetes bacterium]|nr:SGNH/GDSL hydrolase family protein [Armatimonadota bacterium]